MNKQNIIEQLKEFPFDKNDYWIIAGTAMVLYGIKEEIKDIDLACNKEMADSLEKDGFLFRISDDGNRHFKYGDNIEIFENWFSHKVIEFETYQIISIEGLIEMKKELGREKDLYDIKLINDFLNK